MTVETKVDTTFDVERWYDAFRDVAPKAKFVPLSREFVEYLVSDGVYAEREGDEDGAEHSSSSEASSDDDSAGDQPAQADRRYQAFPDVQRSVEAAIGKLGGEVSPKMGNRSPIDAGWINFHGGTKCKSYADVLLLLKSSDRVAAEVYERLPTEVPFTLALHRWANLYPSMEFRAFVRENQVVAISQRDTKSRFAHLNDERAQIVDDVVSFFDRHVAGKFAKERFVMDVYIDQNRRVWLLDLAPFGEGTDALLFSWEELENVLLDGEVSLRLVEREGVGPARCMYYGLPYELQCEGAADALAEAAKKIVERNNAEVGEG